MPLATKDVMNVEVDVEIGKENASMKGKSKESRNDKTLSVFVSGLLLVSCSFLNIVRFKLVLLCEILGLLLKRAI